VSRRYYHIPVTIWQDPRLRSCGEDARTLYTYLRSCPHGNMLGLYYCPQGYIQSDLDWTAERLAPALEALIREGYIYHDAAAQIILVPAVLADDSPDNINQRKHAVKLAQGLPATPLLETLIAVADAVCQTLAEALRNGAETVSKPLPNGSETPRQTVSNTDSRFPIPVTGTERRTTFPRPSDVDDVDKPYPPEFEEFWKPCNPKTDKRNAYRLWRGLVTRKKDPVDPADLARASAAYYGYRESIGLSGKYPATFLGPNQHWKEWVDGVPPGLSRHPGGHEGRPVQGPVPPSELDYGIERAFDPDPPGLEPDRRRDSVPASRAAGNG
jgi:hypothetical protein